MGLGRKKAKFLPESTRILQRVQLRIEELLATGWPYYHLKTLPILEITGGFLQDWRNLLLKRFLKIRITRLLRAINETKFCRRLSFSRANMSISPLRSALENCSGLAR